MGEAIHVVKNPGGGWFVRVEGKADASSNHATQQQAILAGRRLARAKQSRLLIHARSGEIRDRFSYGTSPRRYTS